MRFKPQQLRAIFAKMKLAKLGILGSSKATVPDRELTRSSIKFAGKSIPFAVSRGAGQDKYAKYFSEKSIRSYLSALPKRHVSESSLKGIYVLDEREFSRVVAGIGIRTSGLSATEQFGAALRSEKKVLLGPKPQFMGISHNGRIFMNSTGLRRLVDDTVAHLGKKGMLMRSTLAKGTSKQYFSHEFGHHVDAPSGKLTFGLPIGETSTKELRKSMSTEFLKAVGMSSTSLTEGTLLEIAQAKVRAIESFADLYGQYATNRLALKFTNSSGYKAIRPFFEK